MKTTGTDRIKADLAKKLEKITSPAKGEEEIRARIAEIRAKYVAKKKQADEKRSS